jgi:hypothetical protein
MVQVDSSKKKVQLNTRIPSEIMEMIEELKSYYDSMQAMGTVYKSELISRAIMELHRRTMISKASLKPSEMILNRKVNE